jgi:autophagy-related protein 2
MSRFFEFRDESAEVASVPGDVPFLQRVEVNAVQVKLDFKPKRVDYAGLRSGRTTEFMNFFVLDGADMVLRHVIIYGVSGFDRLGHTLNDIWMPDIKRNQLPGVLAGLAPIRSLVNVGGGVRDLVVVPMREYQKDGRIVRSIQKGALAFAKTTSNELVKLGAKLAIGTQTVLQGAEDLLTAPNTGVASEEDQDDDDDAKKISLYADQPIGVVQGLRGAFTGLERDLLLARDAIVAVPGEVVESGSARAAAKAVWKYAPTVILRPAIGVSKAVGQTLLGAGNTLDPKNRRKMEDVSGVAPAVMARLTDVSRNINGISTWIGPLLMMMMMIGVDTPCFCFLFLFSVSGYCVNLRLRRMKCSYHDRNDWLARALPPIMPRELFLFLFWLVNTSSVN